MWWIWPAQREPRSGLDLLRAKASRSCRAERSDHLSVPTFGTALRHAFVRRVPTLLGTVQLFRLRHGYRNYPNIFGDMIRFSARIEQPLPLRAVEIASGIASTSPRHKDVLA